MRIPFNEVLKNAGFDLSLEYKRLHTLFYEERNAGVYNTPQNHSFSTTYDFFNKKENFRQLDFRGTALDLDDFDNAHKLSFRYTSSTDDIEYLISFCEYIINLFNGFPDFESDFRIRKISRVFIEQITQIVDNACYTSVEKDNCIIFIPKDVTVMTVSEIVDESISYKVILYNHHSLKGNIEEKKKIIRQLADLLEPKRKKLNEINSSLSTDLFNCFNNFNIRHNNTDKSSTHYNPLFETISDSALEYLYDEVYQLCLLAFLELDNVDRKKIYKRNVEK